MICIVLMSWSWIYLIASFSNPLPWGNSDDSDSGLSLFESATNYFFNDVLNVNSSLADGVGDLYWKVVLGLLVSYICVFFAIFKGMHGNITAFMSSILDFVWNDS